MSKTMAFGMAYVLVIVAFHRWYLAPRMVSRALSAAVAVASVQCATIVAMLGISLLLKLMRQFREARAARVSPHIRELLALHAAGNDHAPEIGRLRRVYPREVEQSVVEFLRIVRGRGCETLSELAADLGFIQKWRRDYRAHGISRRKTAVAHLALVSRRFAGPALLGALMDDDETIRLHAARDMIRNADPVELAQIFGLAVNGSRVMRIVLTEDLRPHALELAKEAIPAALTSDEPSRVLAALDVLRGWSKFLPVPQVYGLLRHTDPAINAAALDVLPFVPRLAQLEAEVLSALNHTAEEVRSAAARAAASIGVTSAVPLLAQRLHDQNPRMAAAAAHALAHLGSDGCRILEQEMLTGSLLAASAALEALQRVHFSPTETVAV
ncbi:MAG TPA: HEAT repeat domain-containing protein [Bryobacteraceae bacterium]|nr:HEAT repeat domain-containing protein [Bryobacteraceae bacterium]